MPSNVLQSYALRGAGVIDEAIAAHPRSEDRNSYFLDPRLGLGDNQRYVWFITDGQIDQKRPWRENILGIIAGDDHSFI